MGLRFSFIYNKVSTGLPVGKLIINQIINVMKKTLLTKVMLLLCALIAGSSSVWATITPDDYSEVYSSNVTISATGGTKATASTIVINSTNYDAMKLGTSGNSGNFKITFPAGTKYIHLHVAAWNGKNSNTLSFSGISNYTPSDNITLTANTGIKNNSPYTFGTENGDSNPYSANHYKVITLTNALTSNTEVTITCSERCVIWGVNAEALPTGVTIKNGSTTITSLDMTVGDADVSLSAVVAPELANQAVTWSIQDNGVATISAAGVVHAVTSGTATITATSKTDDSKTATCELTVAAASSPTATISTTDLDFGEVAVGKTKQMTFTVTPANLTGDLTISVDKKYSVSPTSISQATTTEQTITVTAEPTDKDDDMDGTVTISGGGIAQKTVSLSTTLYQETTVTLVATDNHGTFKQGDDVVTSITSRVGGTATIKAIPNDGYLFSSWTAVGATPASSETAETEFTFTATTATLTANFVVDNRVFVSLEGTDIDDMTGETGYGNVKTVTKNGLTWSTTGYKQNATDQYIQLKAASPYPYVKIPELPGAIQTITFSVTNTSATAKDGAKTDGTLRFRTINSTSATNIVSGGGSSTNEIVLDFTGLAQKYSTGYVFLSGSGARIWDITVAYIPAEDIDVTVTDAKYATFSDYVARNFSASGIEVYKAASDGSKVNLTKINDGIVPAYTGVVLFSETVQNNVAIPVATAAGAGDFSDNELVGINIRTMVNATESTKTNYILSNEAAGVGFYKATDGKYLAAHKAYLSTATAASDAPEFLGFDFFNMTTGIDAVNGSRFTVNGSQVYNLNGQRVANPKKGLYIVNGKKAIIK